MGSVALHQVDGETIAPTKSGHRVSEHGISLAHQLLPKVSSRAFLAPFKHELLGFVALAEPCEEEGQHWHTEECLFGRVRVLVERIPNHSIVKQWLLKESVPFVVPVAEKYLL